MHRVLKVWTYVLLTVLVLQIAKLRKICVGEAKIGKKSHRKIVSAKNLAKTLAEIKKYVYLCIAFTPKPARVPTQKGA